MLKCKNFLKICWRRREPRFLISKSKVISLVVAYNILLLLFIAAFEAGIDGRNIDTENRNSFSDNSFSQP